MEQQIKQRLVGAAVLMALAVIFIPIILEGPEEEFGSWGTDIPRPPKQDVLGDLEPLRLPEHGASEPVRRIVLGPSGAGAEEADANAVKGPETPEDGIDIVAGTAPVNVPEPAPQATEKGLRSWVVQVASFREEKNALQLRDRLRKLGYTAFVQQLGSGPARLFRVRVGPELKRSDARAIRDRISSELKLDGIVSRYP